ncbi:ester cyclase [Vulcaniibacterium tengchongense]|uniref:SnoaL-like protein n=1 Tax=Vulcaniibacterium tengchongense TaxID=1273429 RepID=A0A3N4VXU9_9GAMM|nr:nuclear transport factor 2 family protein [Vulcaniibacterium tengchongense]RPE81947.1 SnoaL-like protein [Vulcaniibacterium tengchongense]
MQGRSAIEIVQRFWDEVWHAPQNPDAIDALVHPDFAITSGGHEIRSREAFKRWVFDFQSRIADLRFEVLDIFQSEDGSRVATRWRVTGRNNGLLGTEPDGRPFVMVGNAIVAVGEDGLLRHNWVDRNAYEVHGHLTGHRRIV